MSDNVLDSDLKPCPFCGGKPQLRKAHAWHVICDKCAINGKGRRKGGRAFAVEWWNTRHEQSQWIPVSEMLPIDQELTANKKHIG